MLDSDTSCLLSLTLTLVEQLNVGELIILCCHVSCGTKFWVIQHQGDQPMKILDKFAGCIAWWINALT